MELWSQVEWYVQLVFNVLMFVLPTLIALAATGGLGAVVIRSFKQVYKEFVRQAIDEPTDMLVVLLANKTGRDAALISRFLLDNLDAIVALLPEDQELLASRLIASIEKES